MTPIPTQSKEVLAACEYARRLLRHMLPRRKRLRQALEIAERWARGECLASAEIWSARREFFAAKLDAADLAYEASGEHAEAVIAKNLLLSQWADLSKRMFPGQMQGSVPASSRTRVGFIPGNNAGDRPMRGRNARSKDET